MATGCVSLPKDSNQVNVPSPPAPQEIPLSQFHLATICPGSLIPRFLNYQLSSPTFNPDVTLRPENPETKKPIDWGVAVPRMYFAS